MNAIRRAITTNRHRLLKLPPLSTTQHHHASSYTTTKPRLKTTKTTKTPEPTTTISSSSPQNDTVWEKPSEIPWQAKVVNSVNLIGQVKIPVQFEASPDGKNWAGTIISQDEGSLQPAGSLQSFWIPVIFEGDLAHIAMCHLKEKDYVHVAGHLSVDVPPFKLSEVQANVQYNSRLIKIVRGQPCSHLGSKARRIKDSDIRHEKECKNELMDSEDYSSYFLAPSRLQSLDVMAHSINFVQDSKSTKISTPSDPERWSSKTSVQENNVFIQPPLEERSTMSIQPHTLFEKRTINGTESFPVPNSKKVGRKPTDKPSMLAKWRDLLTNSKQWLDNREKKCNGLVKANYPDFKHKDSGDGLWLDGAPPEILQGLGRLEFCNHPAGGGYFQKVASPPTPTAPRQTSSIPGPSHEKGGH
ncbi:organellar single-stranded DNA binding protein 3 [Artemisia annua]|uniref:Organellar single-stranded DNA binding protein 3 n=1 Tax=Artemisia annua TaxID=35608 RepID=A0A2U1N2N8_ARTAN|nr:organellar single-stranded DNA binding protein 3 [Artemisia annua]